MTFATVVFGSAIVATKAIYTDGSNIGGYRLYIVPTVNVGTNDINIGFTYTNQNNIQKTTSSLTTVPAGTTSGTYIQVTLEPGDTGIRDVVTVSTLSGGCSGDILSFQTRTPDPAITFGNLSMTSEYVHGYISTTAYTLYVVPTTNIGSNSINVTFTYINQDDITHTTSIPTAIPGGTLSDTYILATLEPGDTGVKDIISISISGGCYGDILSFKTQSPDPLVTFGTANIANQFIYTDGSTIGGYKLYIVPTVNMGSTAITITFTYINQNGIQKITPTTTVPAGTVAGTYILANLAVGDTGIQDLINVNTFSGGSSGNALTFRTQSPDPVITFGSVTATTQAIYTPGSGISTGGFRLFVVPSVNMGPAGIDIGFTYIDQFGVEKTTTVTTAIAALTTSGTHIQVVLEPGDTGIRSLVGISYFAGGTPGDSISFESWNEGLGAPAFSITLTNPFDRTVPGSFIPDMYLYEFTGFSYGISTVLQEIYSSNPQVILALLGSDMVGYLPELMIDRAISAREDVITRTTNIIEWIPDPTMRTITGYEFPLLKSWLESVVGQVVSGYVTNTQNEVILNAIKLVLVSSSTSTSQPGGISDALPVDPTTGLYQAFIKGVVYTDRYVVVQAGVGKVTALIGGGTPAVIDGSKVLSIPYNLQFECPTIECDFDLTRKQ